MELAEDVASVVDGVPVTFREIRAARVERQRRHLELVLKDWAPKRRAAFVWVFHNPFFPYMGWHLYVRTISDRWWIRHCDDLALSIMAMFPCGVLPLPENFRMWKQAFVRDYGRPSSTGRLQGMVAGWVDVENGHAPDRFYLKP